MQECTISRPRPSMSDPVRWDDLQVFLAVAQRGSLGAAARALGVNHSTVLRRLAGLERALAVRLFDRLPAGYALTAAGQALAAQLAGVGAQIEDSQRRIRGGDLALEGPVRLTAPDALGSSLLMPHLATFQTLHPRVQVQLVVDNGFLNLTQREADLAVRGTDAPPDNLIGRRVGRLQVALYAAPAYLQAHGTDPAAAHHAWVAPDERLAHLASARWIARHIAADRIVFRCDNLPGLVDAVAAGAGLGLLLCHLTDGRQDLVRLQPPLPALESGLWVLTHPALKQVARVRALADYLVARLREDPRLRPDAG